jgi:glyoxylase-like metal-dependent hydrolase (beta-lactamase superfamily II)
MRMRLNGNALSRCLTLAAVAAATPPAFAAAPFAKGQAPGYYRMMLGDFEVTALSDGTVALPMGTLLTNSTPEKLKDAFARAFLSDPVETSVNAYLVNTGAKLVMIDTGAGTSFGPTLNKLVANLKASGYQPEQVDEIYITHPHGDHIGGLTANGARVFVNATVRLGKRDADYWLSPATLEAAPADRKGMIQGVQTTLKPYQDAGKLKPIEADGELVPGVRAAASNGHTPGHTTYVVESKGARLVAIGDLMHVASVQFDDPSVTIQFDSDSVAAAAQRKKAYADAAREGHILAIAHVSFPGLGRLRTAGDGYVFIPVNYRSAP